MAILTVVTKEKEVGIVADRIIEALRTPFELKGNTCHIGASIGVALFPDSGDDAQSLVKNADIAMYEVKDNGRNHFRIFQPEMVERQLAKKKKG